MKNELMRLVEEINHDHNHEMQSDEENDQMLEIQQLLMRNHLTPTEHANLFDILRRYFNVDSVFKEDKKSPPLSGAYKISSLLQKYGSAVRQRSHSTCHNIHGQIFAELIRLALVPDQK